MTDRTPQELFAAEIYSIYRKLLRSEDQKLFPHEWAGLPGHYRHLLSFVADHARRTGWDDGRPTQTTYPSELPSAKE